MKIVVFMQRCSLEPNPVVCVFGRFGAVLRFNWTLYKYPEKVVCLNFRNNLGCYGSVYWFSHTIGGL